MLKTESDTIAGNLEQLRELAGRATDSALALEIHRLYIDLSEGINDLRQNGE